MASQYDIICYDMGQCKECGEPYKNSYHAKNEWCKSCNVNYFKKKFASWTSGNEIIDDIIQERQLRINHPTHGMTEWIPYNQFSNIVEIRKSDVATVYSAIWKDGPLKYDLYKKEWTRNSDEDVDLYSRNITSEFLNEV